MVRKPQSEPLADEKPDAVRDRLPANALRVESSCNATSAPRPAQASMQITAMFSRFFIATRVSP